MPSLKELCKYPDVLSGGHRLCSGCGASIIARQVLQAAQTTGKETVCSIATGCLEVATTIFPYTAWEVPLFHNAFENSAASCSGMEAAYRVLRKRGKVTKDINFIAFGGDGGTYDIGFQSLSGAMERRHRMLFVCYNNEAYINTGIQRSSATPLGAFATTAPVGKVKKGKEQVRKDLTKAMVAHNLPYVAQTAVGYWNDLTSKVVKALSYDGPTFINALQPCRLGWGYNPEDTLVIGRLAVETCFWPMYEVVDGKYKITVKPREKKPIMEYIKLQSRFKHLLLPENAGIVKEIQKNVDENWAWLQMMEECTNKPLEIK